ncbi:MAG: proline iminopeptidase-family hydrolase [Desulfovibrionaceae bacterium]
MPRIRVCLLALLSLLVAHEGVFAETGADFKRREQFVDVPGGRVWTLTINPGAGGVPLLVVHGGPGATHEYLADLAALADKRPVVFYDQLDCGDSPRSGDPAQWTAERAVAELDAVRQGLGLAQVHLLGQSWGGAVCASYVIDTGGPGVRSLILAAPLLSSARWAADQRAWLEQLPAPLQAAVQQAEASGDFGGEAYQRAMDEYYRRHVCRLAPWPDGVQQAFAHMNAEMYGLMWGPSEFTVTGRLKDFDLTDRLGGITVPTLLTCGEFDEATPESMRHFAARIPGAKVVVFKGGSHMHHLEQPRLYKHVIEDFLEQVEAGEK